MKKKHWKFGDILQLNNSRGRVLVLYLNDAVNESFRGVMLKDETASTSVGYRDEVGDVLVFGSDYYSLFNDDA